MLLNPARQCESWNMMRLGSYVLLHVTTCYYIIFFDLEHTVIDHCSFRILRVLSILLFAGCSSLLVMSCG